MDFTSSVFRPQQTWNPNVPVEQNARLVAYTNEHSYNNLGFSHLPQAPSTSSNHRAYHHNIIDTNGNSNFISSPTSPVSKKGSQQKFAQWPSVRQMSNLVSLKSKIGVEYRRYAIVREEIGKFDDFFRRVESIHRLQGTQFIIYYLDQDGEMLPINNDNNLAKAIDATIRLKTTHYIVANNNNNHHFSPYQYHCQPQPQQVILERPFLKLFLEKKGIPNELYYLQNSSLKCKRKDNLINMLISSSTNSSSDSRPKISMPEDFRQVSSIIDADKLPATRRRVVLKRGDTDKLGFYIMDGTIQRMNSQGRVERHYGIFISRLEPGCLAESTNLLAENDEILEVNGIPVDRSKTLEQVKEMMVANSSNLIITTRPAKPHTLYPVNYHNRMRNRYLNNPGGRDRLPSTQSTGSDLGEDFVRHHMN